MDTQVLACCQCSLAARRQLSQITSPQAAFMAARRPMQPEAQHSGKRLLRCANFLILLVGKAHAHAQLNNCRHDAHCHCTLTALHDALLAFAPVHLTSIVCCMHRRLAAAQQVAMITSASSQPGLTIRHPASHDSLSLMLLVCLCSWALAAAITALVAVVARLTGGWLWLVNLQHRGPRTVDINSQSLCTL